MRSERARASPSSRATTGTPTNTSATVPPTQTAAAKKWTASRTTCTNLTLSRPSAGGAVRPHRSTTSGEAPVTRPPAHASAAGAGSRTRAKRRKGPATHSPGCVSEDRAARPPGRNGAARDAPRDRPPQRLPAAVLDRGRVALTVRVPRLRPFHRGLGADDQRAPDGAGLPPGRARLRSRGRRARRRLHRGDL